VKRLLMLDSGRRLERALSLIALLRSTLALRYEEDALQNQVLEAVLFQLTADYLSTPLRSFIQLPRC